MQSGAFRLRGGTSDFQLYGRGGVRFERLPNGEIGLRYFLSVFVVIKDLESLPVHIDGRTVLNDRVQNQRGLIILFHNSGLSDRNSSGVLFGR